jgi:membrane protein
MRDSRAQQRGPSSVTERSNCVCDPTVPEDVAHKEPWLSGAWSLTRETVDNWLNDNAARLAASLAYYTLLSLAPLVVLAIALAGLEFGEEAAKGQIAHEIAAVVGREAGVAIQSIVANANAPSSGRMGSILGVVVLLFGASGAFVELQSALDAVWRVKPKPGRGVVGVIRDRGFMGKFFATTLPGGEPLWQVLNFFLSLAVTTLLFAVMFKVIPDAVVDWRDVRIGALVTAALFTLGKTLLAIYIGRFGAASAFGAAGSLVALVIWVYYSSHALFLGAEFTRVYACRYGKPIQPSSNAIPIDVSESQPRRPEDSVR